MCDARFVNALSACRTRRYPSSPRRSTRPASRRAQPQAAAGRCSRSAHVTAPCGAPGEPLPGSSAAFALRGSGSVQIGRRRPAGGEVLGPRADASSASAGRRSRVVPHAARRRLRRPPSRRTHPSRPAACGRRRATGAGLPRHLRQHPLEQPVEAGARGRTTTAPPTRARAARRELDARVRVDPGHVLEPDDGDVDECSTPASSAAASRAQVPSMSTSVGERMKSSGRKLLRCAAGKCVAAWITASTPSTAEARLELWPRSALTHSTVESSSGWRARMRTRWPSVFRCSTTTRPRWPVPPVTRIFMSLSDETAARPVTRHAACSSATSASTTLRAAFGLGSTNTAAIAAPTSATPISA